MITTWFPARAGQRVARQLGATAVVRTDESQVEAGLLLGGGVERDVEVDHRDAGLDRLDDRGDHRLRVGWRQDDDVHLLRDEALDGHDLRVEVGASSFIPTVLRTKSPRFFS